VEFHRTVSVAWCSYSFVAQLRDWLPDEVGGVCWVAVDNPGQSPRVPIFCGNSRLPKAFNLCGQKEYNENAVLWQYRKANKLATVAWQRTKEDMMKKVLDHEQKAISGLAALERSVNMEKQKENEDYNPKAQIANMLNDYTFKIYDATSYSWKQLESTYWHMFGMGF